MSMFFLFIINNFFKKQNILKNYYTTYKRLSKNKSFEFEIFYSSSYLFKLQIDTSFRGKDHAGFDFEIVLLGLEFNFRIYDNRHWDYKNNCWEL